jgi:5-methylcytosine-specific restriction protein A
MQEGRRTLATIRDHIVPLAEGGAEGTEENEQPLCRAHSDAKTAEEAKRGARRSQHLREARSS